MEIVVAQVNYKQEKQQYEIAFSSILGAGKGIWHGHSLPSVSQCYHVELGSSENLKWGSDIYPIESSEMLIRYEGDITFIRGQVLDIQEECIEIRLGDFLETFMVHGQPGRLQGFVEIKFRQLELYDMNL